MNSQEQQFVQELCLDVQLMQQRYMAVSPWVLASALLVGQPRRQTSLPALASAMGWLRGTAADLGTRLHWPGR